MSYLVLARKYRPRSFADLAGQEVVARTLQGALTDNRVGHAYLFTGPRGTGKTTVARILAKALNCEKGPVPDPCGTCASCLAIDAGAHIDLIEIDAASNRGIDDVRELRSQVATAPMQGRFKVYIVDEVHMMTVPAFNALLKTLEEPPAHVVFLLATTDPHKIPGTITSRCQVLKLTPLPEALIAARLEHVFASENVRPQAGVAQEIARRSRGGMRDALSLADQLLSLVGEAPALADLERLSSSGGAELADRLLELLAAHDRAGILSALPATEGGEGEIAAALIERLRAALLLLHVGKDTPLVALDAAERARLHERAERAGTQRLEGWLDQVLHARERIGRSGSHGRAALELALLDSAREEVAMPLSELERRLASLEARLAGNSPRGSASAASASARDSAPTRISSAPPLSSAPSPAPRSTPPPPPDAIPRPESRAQTKTDAPVASPPTATRARPRSASETWERFLETLEKHSSSLSALLRLRGRLVEHAENRAVVQLSNLRQTERAQLEDARNVRLCQEAFQSATGLSIELALEDQTATRATTDAYTGRVATMFDGRLEDGA